MVSPGCPLGEAARHGGHGKILTPLALAGAARLEKESGIAAQRSCKWHSRTGIWFVRHARFATGRPLLIRGGLRPPVALAERVANNHHPPMPDRTTYETDIVLWSAAQARALRAEAAVSNLSIDWHHVAEEIEALGRSERSALRSHIATVIEHLIKLQASPAIDPRNHWKESVQRARDDIARVLEDSPSLSGQVEQMIFVKLLGYYGEQPTVDIGTLSYTRDQVLGDWMPPEP